MQQQAEQGHEEEDTPTRQALPGTCYVTIK